MELNFLKSYKDDLQSTGWLSHVCDGICKFQEKAQRRKTEKGDHTTEPTDTEGLTDPGYRELDQYTEHPRFNSPGGKEVGVNPLKLNGKYQRLTQKWRDQDSH